MLLARHLVGLTSHGPSQPCLGTLRGGQRGQSVIFQLVFDINLFNYNRSGGDKGGGGLCIYYKDSLSPHPWLPKVQEDLKYVENERQWLLIDNGKERVALLHFYIACQSNRNDDFLK